MYRLWLPICLLGGLCLGTPVFGQWSFVRGDANGDGAVDVADAISSLSYLFQAGALDCLDAGDTNDDGEFDVAERHYEKALEIAAAIAPDGDLMVETCWRFAELLAAQGRTRECREHVLRAELLCERNADRRGPPRYRT